MGIWLGLVLATGAWLFTSTIVAPARPAVGIALGGLAVLCVVAGMRRRRWGGDARGPMREVLTGLAGLIAAAAAQWLVHAFYWRVSPYYHPSVGGSLLAPLLRLCGADAVHAGANVSIQLLSSVIHVRPSLERLGLYPISLLWMAGIVFRVVAGDRWRLSVLAAGALFAAYACGRFAVLSLLAGDLDSPAMFWNPWVTLASLLPLGLLSAVLMPMGRAAGEEAGASPSGPAPRTPGLMLAGGLALSGAAALAFALHAERAGEKKPGRVLLDDLHSGHWEVSTGEFNEESYGEKAIYNYICLRDWLNQFYTVRVNTESPLTGETLHDVDVLVLKTPTQPFTGAERDAIERFVQRGGGLWLVGDHTNLFGMSTYLNPIAGLFGLRFHSDDTFDNNTGQPSEYKRPVLARHPVVAPLEWMEFETSATLSAPLLARPVMIGYQLGSELVDYGHVNFFGNISVDPEDEYGLFLQAAAVSHGRGRVLAFADSTVFSSFSMFLPGVPELAEGSVEYLNHTEPGRGPLLALAGLALGLSAAGAWLARPWRSAAGMFLLATGLAGGSALGAAAATVNNARLYTRNELKDANRRALVDTSVSSFRLPSSLEYDVVDPDRCFDTFYLNLARLGLHPLMTPALGLGTPAAPLRIFIQPTLAPSDAQLAELRRFVEGGGRVMILESSVFTAPATQRLLEAVGMQVVTREPAGTFELSGAAPVAVPRDRMPRLSHSVSAFRKQLGAGTVMYINGAEWFSRKFMGQVYTQPDPLERDFHRLQYYFFHLLEDTTEHVATRS